jgi:hypothetical protein
MDGRKRETIAHSIIEALLLYRYPLKTEISEYDIKTNTH